MKIINNITPFVEEAMQISRKASSFSDNDLNGQFTDLVNRYLYIDDHVQSNEVTILLSDLRGFTALSEQYRAAEIVSMLNNYFSRMNEIINHYNGMIDKYMGDAIMVVFGLPEGNSSDPKRAIACAVEMQIAMDEVNAQNQSLGLPQLFAGIGINTGIVSAGKIGSDIHEEFTVIGDGVNLASRIESYSLRGQILISQYTYDQVKDIVQIGAVNAVRVKGKSELVKLYEVISINWEQNLLQVPKREVRNSVRLEIDTDFSYQVIKGKTVLPQYHTGKIKDISYDGLFAVLEQDVEPLTNIKLSLALSLLGGKSKDIYAKIVSVRKLTSGFGCGVEFTSLDEECQSSIKNFIDRIIQGS